MHDKKQVPCNYNVNTSKSNSYLYVGEFIFLYFMVYFINPILIKFLLFSFDTFDRSYDK